ncbi:MAG: gfo/Idh/MocA family oxidoreductase [Gammaproteobacteria bacterium]|nr:MAG: gfo/Idh/MocA family oxidoreductase [Gammaproteobacteria bacterium]
MSDGLRVVCIGLGQRLAHVLLHLIRTAPAVNCVAYADPEPAGLARLERHGIVPKRYEQPAVMLREVRPDAVMIGSPNHLHHQHLALALATDARIFCEKPLVRTEAESFEVASWLAREPRDRVIVGLVLRSLPVVRAALETIRSGRLGAVVSFEANEHLPPEHGGYLRRDWRRLQRYAGSYLLDKCCHDLDLLNAVAASRPRRMASFAGNLIFTPAHAHLDDGVRYRQWPTGWGGDERVFDADADTADVQVLAIEYGSGVIGTFHTHSHVVPPRRAWFVAGTEASMEVDLRAGRLDVLPALADPETLSFGDGSVANHSGADPAMAADLAATWLDGATFPVTVREALEAGLTVMAADRAAMTQSVVDLDPLWSRLDALLP